jgi:mannose/cellobiose epimerase-like protein (N-acyl-D-glucosamine 2-epimerase family)
MSDTKHTPGNLTSDGSAIVAEDGLTIAYTCDHSNQKPTTKEQRDANAAELVRRWNTHPALLEALLAEEAWRDEPDTSKWEELRIKARKLRESAIATARA